MAISLVGDDASMRTALLLALVLVVAGCDSGGKHTRPASLGPAVPWTDARPAQVAERTPVSRACRAADLGLRGEIKLVARLQVGIALVSLWNHSNHPCRLAGRPSVQIGRAHV